MYALKGHGLSALKGQLTDAAKLNKTLRSRNLRVNNTAALTDLEISEMLYDPPRLEIGTIAGLTSKCKNDI